MKCLAYAEITEEQIEDGEDVDGLVAEQLRRELRNQSRSSCCTARGRTVACRASSDPALHTDALAVPTVGPTGAVSYGFDMISQGCHDDHEGRLDDA